MLHNPKFEPAIGAQALCDGETVKVYQRLPGGWFLVLGERATKRVDASQLLPPPEPTVFERWIAERTHPGSDQLVTPLSVLFADYEQWLEREGLSGAWPINSYRFRHMLAEAGVRSFVARWREPGETQNRARRVCPLLLKAAA